MIITGVGNCRITEEGIRRIKEVSEYFNKLGYTLRSGGAEGADSAFESVFDKKEIYLPWKNFNNNDSQYYNLSNEVYALAATVHPYFYRMRFGAKKLHSRNCYQVLGYNLDRPSDVLVCWTRDGAYNEESSSVEHTGGTRTAIVLADRYKVPIYNLNIDTHYDSLLKWLRSQCEGLK